MDGGFVRAWRPALLALSLLASAACDAFMTEPADAGTDFALVMAPEFHGSEDFSFGNLSGALASVRSVRLRLSYEGGARDTVASVLATGDTVRVHALLRPSEARGWLGIEAELLTNDARPLFQGRALVQAYRISPTARMVLLPVVSDFQVPWLPQRITALGDSVNLTVQARFANGDLIAGAPVDWVSDDPAIIDVVSPNRAVSRSSGHAVLSADILGVSRSFPVEVRQVPFILTGVAPADTVIAVGATYQARPFGTDRNGFPLLPGASVAWTGLGAVEVASDGTVTAVAPGEGTVQASLNGETWVARVTVTP